MGKWGSRLGTGLVGAGLSVGITLAAAAAQEAPPVARRGDDVSVYHGVRVAEPYRWLERMTSPEVERWARAHDTRARAFAAADAAHVALLGRIRVTAAHDRYVAPLARGTRLFLGKVNASFTRFELLVREGLHGLERTLVDPDSLERDGLVVDRSFWPSPDGRTLAYGVSPQGSRWMEVRFLDVESGRALPDRIHGLQGALLSRLTWSADGSGVWYDAFELPPPAERLSAPLRGSHVAFHRLGTSAEDDVLAMRAGHPDEVLLHAGTDDGRWIAVSVLDGRRLRRVMLLDGSDPKGAPRVLIEEPGDDTFTLVGGTDGELWFYTNRDAPRGRVVAIPVERPDPSGWSDVLPQQNVAIDTWMGVDAVGDGLVAGFRRHGLLEMRYFAPGSTAGEPIELPTIGSIWFGVSGRQGNSDFYYLLSGFADPGTVYRHDLRSGRSEPFLVPELSYDPTEIVTRQVFYDGPAGERVPMFLAHHRDVTPDGTHPVMMYGYAFLNWPASPWFRAHMYEWFRMGGVFALPALRGGGEYGAEWAEAGIRMNRQNAIDDFVAAAAWLVAEGLARPEGLVAETNSAGASVVGAAIVQRPDLFGAAMLGFPLLDVLHYHEFTGGRRWTSQLGTVDDPTEARALLAYSPVHNVVDGRCYPATLVTPGELDETTPPFHAYKFVARLSAAQSCDRPVLLRVAWGAGHAYGRDQETTIESFADQLAFLRRVLGMGTRR